MSAKPTVSVLGLGLMGRPMARNLAAAGFDVRGWNRSSLAAELTEGIPLAASLEDAARADVLLLMLSDSAAVGHLLSQLGPLLSPGQVVLDMGSSSPVDTRERAAQLAARGIGWVDAPVSGGAEGAAAATLAVMAGGSKEDVTRVQPVLEAVGANVVHVGGPAAGHTAKIVNQVIVGLAHEAVAEAIALAEAAGLDPRLVQQALRGGWADSRILQGQGTRMIERDWVPGGRVRTLRKDLAMAAELARELELELPHLDSALELYDRLVECGDGDLDCAAIYTLRAPRGA
jgi:3-hydroxyisobutyrate dehydrogenase-like beta-hydroxyacid dehydrogenase